MYQKCKNDALSWIEWTAQAVHCSATRKSTHTIICRAFYIHTTKGDLRSKIALDTTSYYSSYRAVHSTPYYSIYAQYSLLLLICTLLLIYILLLICTMSVCLSVCPAVKGNLHCVLFYVAARKWLLPRRAPRSGRGARENSPIRVMRLLGAPFS